MAIFERFSNSIIIIDDTERLTCSLENAQNINNHTEYILRVQKGPSKENKWTVSRRYRDFAALHVGLQHANIELPIPPKKLIGNMQPSFVAERQIALQTYINKILNNQVLALSLPVRTFLDPNNYSLSIAEQALQTMSIALRGDGQYELKGPLVDIGWRVRKHYFLVNEIQTQTNCMLSWQSYGPDHVLNSKDLHTAFKSLQNISHPYIDDILSIHTMETGAYVVRRIHESGTVRDLLYGTGYNKSYLSKYGNPKVRKPFTMGQVAHYGYQILQALKFLHEKGLPHGHIHPGNIAIENQRALLMDLDNFLMGVPCLYRPYLVELKKINTCERIDMYCFGRTLYEMAFATTLDTYYCDNYPDDISENLESILALCLSSITCKYGRLSLDSLLYHPFFTRTTLNGSMPKVDTRSQLKFPLNIKDQIKSAVTAMEERLSADQKSVRSAKREVRIQEILGSEQELKKQKRRVKKRESVWKSTSSLAEVRSHSGSTASSPTPPTPPLSGETSVASATSTHAATSTSARGALLSDICCFDKARLAQVSTRKRDRGRDCLVKYCDKIYKSSVISI